MGLEGFLGAAYLWVKAVHIIFVIFWMAALFMMPRYFAYQMEAGAGSPEDALWTERQKRLKRIIMNPSMHIAWVMGILLVLNVGFAAGGWLHAKLALVVALTGFHIILTRWHKALAAGDRSRSSKFYRLANEIPAFAIIAVVLLVIVRPF